MVSLADLPVIDNHCHPWRNDVLLSADPLGLEDRSTMLGMCTMSSGTTPEDGGAYLRSLTDSTPFALTLRRRLAGRLRCEPTREAVARARHAAFSAGPAAYNRLLLDNANVVGLVYDEGYPQPTLSYDDVSAATGGVSLHRVARIEPWIARLREECPTYGALEEAFINEMEVAASDPRLVAYKSVIAYRTGLDVTCPSREESDRAFERWRHDGYRETRENAKPVRDALLQRAFEVAKRRERPVHIHCGGGDPDIVLRHAHPQDLFPFLKSHADQPIVLIHAGWPWTEEAAYIASILPQVYLDMSVMMPWASLAIDQKLEVLLGVAPPAKLLYGSDEASEPEVIWLSAQLGREALERVLTTATNRGWLDEREARSIGEGVLADNTRRLHNLPC